MGRGRGLELVCRVWMSIEFDISCFLGNWFCISLTRYGYTSTAVCSPRIALLYLQLFSTHSQHHGTMRSRRVFWARIQQLVVNGTLTTPESIAYSKVASSGYSVIDFRAAVISLLALSLLCLI